MKAEVHGQVKVQVRRSYMCHRSPGICLDLSVGSDHQQQKTSEYAARHRKQKGVACCWPRGCCCLQCDRWGVNKRRQARNRAQCSCRFFRKQRICFGLSAGLNHHQQRKPKRTVCLAAHMDTKCPPHCGSRYIRCNLKPQGQADTRSKSPVATL